MTQLLGHQRQQLDRPWRPVPREVAASRNIHFQFSYHLWRIVFFNIKNDLHLSIMTPCLFIHTPSLSLCQPYTPSQIVQPSYPISSIPKKPITLTITNNPFRCTTKCCTMLEDALSIIPTSQQELCYKQMGNLFMCLFTSIGSTKSF